MIKKGRVVGFFYGQIFDRKILKEVFSSFTLGIMLFVLITLLLQFNRLSKFVFLKGLPISDIALLMFLLLIVGLPLVIPVSFLFSVLKTFSRMSSEFELLAYQASGISLWRLSLSSFGLALILCFFNFGLSYWGVPMANKMLNNKMDQIYASQAIQMIQEKKFLSDFFGLSLYVEKIEDRKLELKNIFLKDERQEMYKLLISAEKAFLLKGLGSWAVVLKLLNGQIMIENPQEKTKFQKIQFDHLRLNVLKKSDVVYRETPSSALDGAFLHKELAKADLSAGLKLEYQLEFQKRLAVSASSLFFVILGLVFGLTPVRGSAARSAILAILFLLFYFVAYLLGVQAAQKSWLQPQLAMWMPNFILLFLSIWKWRQHLRTSLMA